jgi:hypothetical protein
MPGLRGDDDIFKAFEGLDKVPGSNRKRRELSELAKKRQSKILGESNGWDAEPIIKTIQGTEVEVFPIGSLAKALEKEVVTIRLWEKKGYIPQAPYRLRSKSLNGTKVKGNRVYTRELIEIAVEEFSLRGLLGSPRVEWNLYGELTDVLVARWRDSVQRLSKQS